MEATVELPRVLHAFANQAIEPFDQTTTRIYDIDFSYERDFDFPVERFEQTELDGILYRPAIVAAMKDILLTGHERKGLFVRGPHGVGKSHSLVNLVRSLRADGHIVSFIPTCEHFIRDADFLGALCKSIGSDMEAIGITLATSDTIMRIISIIEDALAPINKNWFFVFDQVNRIFARPEYATARDVGVLPLPFSLMKHLNDRARIKTVISASANNTVAYKDNHPGFIIYDHPTTMSRAEALIWKTDLGNLNNEQLGRLLEVTGLCPLQISNYLAHEDPLEFEAECVSDVAFAVERLLSETESDLATQSIVKVAVRCLLSLPLQKRIVTAYDKKYSVLKDEHVVPLYPLVLVAYRLIFWDDLLLFVEQNEASILQVCANTEVTNDVRGRLFELLVIVRFRKNSVLTRFPEREVLPASVDSGLVFETQELPTPQMMANNTLFIPKNSNFPAIDLILKSNDGTDVWAVQVHVADHDDVLPAFKMMCEAKGWHEAFENIYLVYLGPSDAARNMLTCIPRPGQRRIKRPRSVPPNPIHVSATTIQDFECLRDIQWTAPLLDDAAEPAADAMVS